MDNGHRGLSKVGVENLKECKSHGDRGQAGEKQTGRGVSTGARRRELVRKESWKLLEGHPLSTMTMTGRAVEVEPSTALPASEPIYRTPSGSSTLEP